MRYIGIYRDKVHQNLGQGIPSSVREAIRHTKHTHISYEYSRWNQVFAPQVDVRDLHPSRWLQQIYNTLKQKYRNIDEMLSNTCTESFPHDNRNIIIST